MRDYKISELDSSLNLKSVNLMPVVDEGTTRKVELSSFWEACLDGSLNSNNTATFKQNLQVTENTILGSDSSNSTTVNGDLNVLNDVYIDGNATLGSNSSSITTINGTLNVTGGLGLNGDITIEDNFFTKTDSVLGDDPTDTTTINGTLKANNNVEIEENLLVNGNSTLGNQITDVTTILGILSANNQVFVNGNTTLGNDVFDVTTINGILKSNNSIEINQNLLVKGNSILGDSSFDSTDINGTLNANNNVIIDGDLITRSHVFLGDSTSDRIVINGMLSANNDVLIKENLIVEKDTILGNNSTDTTTINGTLNPKNNVLIEQNLSVKGNSVLGDHSSDTTTIQGNLTANNHVRVLGDLAIDGTMSLNNFLVNGNLTVNGDTFLGNNLSDTTAINGKVRFLDLNSFLGNTNFVVTYDPAFKDLEHRQVNSAIWNTAAVFLTSGSLSSSSFGDVDVNGDLFVKGNTTLGDSPTDITTINGDLTANNNVHIKGNLKVDGNTTLGDSPTDITTINGDLTTNNDVHIKGDLKADGDVIAIRNNPVLNLQNTSGSNGSGGILRFGHDQSSSTIPVAEIASHLTNGAGASQRAGDLKFSTASSGVVSERMRITSSGNVGIGTTNPTQNLDVYGNILASGSGNIIAGGNSSTAGVGFFRTTDNLNYRVVIGETQQSPNNGAVSFQITNQSSENTNRPYIAGHSWTEPAGFGFAAGFNRWGLFLGQQTASLADGRGAVQMLFLRANQILCEDIRGFVVGGLRSRAGTDDDSWQDSNIFNIGWNDSTTATVYVDNLNLGPVLTSSDYRIKRNIETQAEPALERISKIRPVVYQPADYKMFKKSEEIREGFIAHELAEIIPSAVNGQKDAENEIQSLKLDALCSVMVKAIQELNEIVEKQSETISSLTKKLEALEK